MKLQGSLALKRLLNVDNGGFTTAYLIHSFLVPQDYMYAQHMYKE